MTRSPTTAAPSHTCSRRIKDGRGDYDGAIADYSEVIRLNPRDAASYNNRGSAWNAKGEHDKAILDLEASLKLDPNNQAARLNRGFMAVGEGRFGEAAEHFSRTMQTTPPTAYMLLWQYVARARAGADGQKESEARTQLSEQSVKLAERSFHSQIVEFYLGRTDEPGLRKSAQSPTDACETDYFVAQHHLIQGETARGVALLQSVTKNCPANFHETWAARVELRRLMQQ